MKKRSDSPIAFFDSGVGGISVLNEAMKMMPNENYIYFGDSQNAPYGIKTTGEVKKLTERNVEFLLEEGAKAVVIACNTATSAAAEHLRNKYKDIPIVGVEPALKPAALGNKGKKVLVMATPMTLAEKKFSNLMSKYDEFAEIVPVPCGGLMEFVEAGRLEGQELEVFLRGILNESLCEGAAAVVLGCTHYPFIKNSIIKTIGRAVEIYDGGDGTAKQLKRRLEKSGLLGESNETGNVRVLNSMGEGTALELSRKLINREEFGYGK